MQTQAVILTEARRLSLATVQLDQPGSTDVIVDVDYSGISVGTERLFWSGEMPPFPGMGYPLVPGYEAVGRVMMAGAESGRREGEFVFVPGASCFGSVRGLFGASAGRLVVPGKRAVLLDERLEDQAILFALAATAHHAIAVDGARLPELIIGHGVVGRLLARLTIAKGGPEPIVWETDEARHDGAVGYTVTNGTQDTRRDYTSIYDASGDNHILDAALGRLAKGGEIVLAGFYSGRPSFAFPPAFLREMRLRVAAEWSPGDLVAVTDLVATGRLSLDNLITHRRDAADAPGAYTTAFENTSCLKMVLDWRAFR
jgi:bacteriochlorophyllide a dehydrogenase